MVDQNTAHLSLIKRLFTVHLHVPKIFMICKCESKSLIIQIEISYSNTEMKNLFFGLGFLGLATCVELCGESCNDLDQQFNDINEVIAKLKSENEAIEAENDALERDINRLYVRI